MQNKDRRLAYIRTTKDRAVLRSKDKNYDMSYLNLHVSGYFRLCHTKQHNYFQEPDGWVQHIRSPIDLLQFSEDVSLHDRYIKLFQRLIKYAKKRNLL